MPDDLIGYEASSLTAVEAVLDGLDPATAKEVYLGTRNYDARAVAAVAASRADAGGGGGFLEDSGNNWQPDTAVAEGYQIAETVEGQLRVWEVVTGGTTLGSGTFVDNYAPFDLSPLGTLADNTVVWRYLGIVGHVSWENAPVLEGLTQDGDTRELLYTSPSEPGDSENLVSLRATVSGVPFSVFEASTDGDADWLLDENTGAGFRFGVAVDGVGVVPNLQVQMTTEGFTVTKAGTGSFVVNFNPWQIRMTGLPTADPAVAGQLWNSAGTLKVSAG